MNNLALLFKLTLSFSVLFTFNIMLVHDIWMKKISFVIAILITIFFLQANQNCARTAPYLLKVICLQILMMGLIISQKQKILAYLYQSTSIKKQHGKINQQAVIFTLMLIILSVSSVIGFAYSIYADYYLQLFSDDLYYMLLIIFGGFVLVGAADYLYQSIKKQGLKNSARRKIFHFVPSILFPLLASINFKLFTLIAFGFFYLFWLVENGRYFGKLARRSQKSLNENKIRPSLQVSHKTHNSLLFLTDLAQKLNVRLSELSFFQWMESLNQAREPYFWFTHLSLIVGLCITYVYYGPSSSHSIQIQLKQNISVILTLADAMAAIIGSKYGKKTHIVPYTNKKTIEGYVGYLMTATLAQIVVYKSLSALRHSSIEINYTFILLSSGVCAIGELYSGDMDNIVCGLMYIFVDWLYNFLFLL